MSTPILVPVDGSRFAEQGLPFAVELARRYRAPLRIVRAGSALPPDPDIFTEDAYLNSLVEAIRPEWDDVEAEVLPEVGPFPTYTALPADHVADLIAAHADQIGARMLVMTTHGRGGVVRMLLGSVADSLLRTTDRPVLLIRPRDERFTSASAAEHAFEHFLLPLDGSAKAEQAIHWAVELGRPFDASYTLVRVISPVTWEPQLGWMDAIATPELSEVVRTSASEYLKGIVTAMRSQGLRVQSEVTMARSAASGIMAAASARAAGVILVASDAPGAVRRAVLGSVTDRLVRTCAVPVLVVPAGRAAGLVRPAPRSLAVPAEP